MKLPRNFFPLACAAAAIGTQACVEYAPPPPPSAESAQYAPPQAPPADYVPPPPTPPANGIDSLVAPIALYPDPLLALVLPASTLPEQVSDASGYLIQYGDLGRAGGRAWDPSIQALAHYPTLVNWMAQNLAWTQNLGNAFASDPAGVMTAIQRVRAAAVASGRLVSTPQQSVVEEDGEIEVIPAQYGEVYIPSYDPNLLYVSGGDGFIDYGDGYPCGEWLTFSFDWRRHSVWSGGGDVWLSNGAWRRAAPQVAAASRARDWRPQSIPPPVAGRPVPRSGPAPIRRGAPGPAGPTSPGTRYAAPPPRPTAPLPRETPPPPRETPPSPREAAPRLSSPAPRSPVEPAPRPRLSDSGAATTVPVRPAAPPREGPTGGYAPASPRPLQPGAGSSPSPRGPEPKAPPAKSTQPAKAAPAEPRKDENSK
jgi:hypothetical protein